MNNKLQEKTKEITSDEAFILDTEIKQLRKQINNNFWLLVKNLRHARKWRVWAILGYESWEAYLSQPEIDLNSHTVEDYIYVYNNTSKYINSSGQSEETIHFDIDISKLKVIAPHLNETNAEELLEKARVLSRSDLRKEIQEEKFKQLPKPEIPQDKYEVIVIDPPWPYGTIYDPEYRRVGNPYPEMELDEIKDNALGGKSIEDITTEDSVIWLWTTHKFLPSSFYLLEKWGFDYKLTMIWNKERMGMGYWLRCQAEFCLLGVKGKPNWILENERDVLNIVRKEHSRKPDEFYEMVKRLSPNTKRIDIFSREKRDGFEQYGNEPDKF